MILTPSRSIVTRAARQGGAPRRVCQRQAQRLKPAVHHQLDDLECRFHLMLRNRHIVGAEKDEFVLLTYQFV
jgi:hypothetical protein